MGKIKLNKSAKIKIVIVIILILIILFLLFSNLFNIKFEIKFHSNGGTAIYPFIVEKNGLATEPKDPVRKGYIFAGWYYNGELFDFSKPIKNDIELEAKWVKLSDITGIRLDKEELIMKPGESYELKATFLPINIISDYVVWESSNDSVVSVDEYGKITAKANGEVLITATTKDKKHTATIKVIVNSDAVKVTGISLDKTNVSLNVRDTYKLNATIKPSNATNKGITWTSSNPSVATVDANGNVKALKEGTATITATTEDGNYVANVTVKVSAVKVTGISLNKTNVSLYINESTKLSATIKPSNATNKGVTWTSSNPSVATVDANGNVKAVGVGTAIITVKSNNGGYTAKATVKVSAVKVTGISLNKTNVSLYINESTKLSATIKPSNATNKGVTWTSSNPSVATVDANGNVKAVGVGTAIITVKSNDGGYTATCTLTVAKKEASYTVIIEKKEIDVINATYQYNISVTKDGSLFSDYDGIEYGGIKIAKGQFLSSTQYNGGITSAKVYINGAPIAASVLYR